MSVRLGIVMDPIDRIKVHKDSSFAMLLAAQSRDWQIFYMEQQDLYLKNGSSHAGMRVLQVRDDPEDWYSFSATQDRPLSGLDLILMRKDPPLDLEFMYSLFLLELAERSGVMVVNSANGIRDSNEKLFTAWYPDLCTASLVSKSMARLRAFLEEQEDIIVKPLDAMGGASVFRIRRGDPNTSVILEASTVNETQTVMAQAYIPEIKYGDKRILMIDGVPVPYALARIPAVGETRGNLAAGGRGEGVELNRRDREICDRLGPELRKRGLLFVGLDVIGDYLTEINVTSPTCIRELDHIYGLNIADQFLTALEKRLDS